MSRDYRFDVDTLTYVFRDNGKVVYTLPVERAWRNQGILEDFGVPKPTPKPKQRLPQRLMRAVSKHWRGKNAKAQP